MLKDHLLRFAVYNRWANRRVFSAAETLSEDKLWLDKGSFFGSLMGTLNHILVTDRLWMARFRAEAPPDLRLNTVLHRDLSGLRQARAGEDEGIVDFVGRLEAERLGGELTYRTTRGDLYSNPFDVVLLHFFNHQTHHRGQVHCLLSQLGAEPPELDLIYFVRHGQA